MMNTPHISDDLPRLLTGEATRDAVMTAADHLRDCPDCQQELVSAVVAHASLTSAHRFAPDVVAPLSEQHPFAGADDVDLPDLPDLAGMFAQVREEAAAEAARPRFARRQLALAVAAAAVVIVGGGTAVTLIATGSSSSSGRSMAMSGAGNVSATATLTGDRLHIDATSLPKLGSADQYEVWLTKGHDAPQSIGFIDSDRRADLTVPTKVLAQYDGIAVSKQAAHQTEYSGDTVIATAPGQHLS